MDYDKQITDLRKLFLPLLEEIIEKIKHPSICHYNNNHEHLGRFQRFSRFLSDTTTKRFVLLKLKKLKK